MVEGGAVDDYYQLVGVDRAAPRDEIDRKIRDELRRWQRRTANADLDRRQEAERRVRQLGEARITLLDEAKRRQYDRQLTALRASDPPPATVPSRTSAPTRLPDTVAPPTPTRLPDTTTGSANWLDQARGYLAQSDYQSAAYAARETLRSMPNPPAEAWALLAQANAGLGRLDDALFEARRAVAAEPANVVTRLALANVHEYRREWDEACRAYEEASRLAPNDEATRVGQARTLARWGRLASAADRLERHYATARYASPGEQLAAGRVLARGLAEAAWVVVQAAGTGRQQTAELAQVQRMLTRAREVTVDMDVLKTVSDLEGQLQRRTATPPPRNRTTPTYPQRPAWPPQPVPRTNGLATIALVLSLLVCLAPIGAIMGHLARAQIRDRGEGGDSVAQAAIIVGWTFTVVGGCIGAVVVMAS